MVIVNNNRAAREAGVSQSPQTTGLGGAAATNSVTCPAPTFSQPRPIDFFSISGAHGTPVYDPIRDFAILKKVLVKTPELAALHRELVVGGQIAETEFWDWSGGARALDRCSSLCLCPTPRPPPSISCSRRQHPTRRRRVNRASHLIRGCGPRKAVKTLS